jgi:hypothetical protein
MVDNSHPKTQNISVEMYSSLMSTFKFMVAIHYVYAMSSRPVSSEMYAPFCTSYFNNPWTLPSSTSSCEGHSHVGMAMPLSATEIEYQVVLNSSVNPDLITLPTDEDDVLLHPVWAPSLS